MVNKLFDNIPKDSITKLKELIYVRTKLVSDKISLPLRTETVIKNKMDKTVG